MYYLNNWNKRFYICTSWLPRPSYRRGKIYYEFQERYAYILCLWTFILNFTRFTSIQWHSTLHCFCYMLPPALSIHCARSDRPFLLFRICPSFNRSAFVSSFGALDSRPRPTIHETLSHSTLWSPHNPSQLFSSRLVFVPHAIWYVYLPWTLMAIPLCLLAITISDRSKRSSAIINPICHYLC